MEWNDLAPWITIAITLALSILVPLFTQIANNSHQRKMQREKMEYEQRQKRIIVYEDFLKNVGAAITEASKENLALAGASVANMYIFVPTDWWNDLDMLQNLLMHYKWDEAENILKKLSRLIAEEIETGRRKNHDQL